ncbi:hypothetical protein [Desulfallas thermosapovorans]|uniref:Uncharacterized protein n=1 Tax=Desulfallas thermosapovorans DSM 6562 TaxID=1121431 RepID=A0A5S4ZQA5_9FIRM|nr:hypothetical protein [Desulfallas thermosapovorans]TYO94862.1 hypothetical protein LX24_02115 [Desulfallas thermosapovorans DSM 6562]
MDYSDPGQRYQKGMNYGEKINFSYELEQEIVENKEELAKLKDSNEDEARIEELEARIRKNEKLLQDVQNDIHLR